MFIRVNIQWKWNKIDPKKSWMTLKQHSEKPRDYNASIEKQIHLSTKKQIHYESKEEKFDAKIKMMVENWNLVVYLCVNMSIST